MGSWRGTLPRATEERNERSMRMYSSQHASGTHGPPLGRSETEWTPARGIHLCDRSLSDGRTKDSHLHIRRLRIQAEGDPRSRSAVASSQPSSGGRRAERKGPRRATPVRAAPCEGARRHRPEVNPVTTSRRRWLRPGSSTMHRSRVRPGSGRVTSSIPNRFPRARSPPPPYARPNGCAAHRWQSTLAPAAMRPCLARPARTLATPPGSRSSLRSFEFARGSGRGAFALPIP